MSPAAAAKHLPLRRCVACRDSRPQAELIRFYRGELSQWRLDAKQKAGGRGAWICKDKVACHNEKVLKRFFRSQALRISKEIAALRQDEEVNTQTSKSQHNSRIGGVNV